MNQELGEDDYVEQLARVIQRDYFPELPELRDRHEYLLADKRDDFARKHEIEVRKRQRMEEEMKSNEEKEVAAPGFESVDAFLNTWTSEDNASFADLQEKELMRRRAHDEWGAQVAQLRDKEAQKKLLLLENGTEGPLLAIESGTAASDPNKQLMRKTISPSKQVYELQLYKAAAEYKQRVIDRNNTRLTEEELVRLSTLPKDNDPEKKRKKLSLLVQKNRFLEGDGPVTRHTIDLDDFYDVPDKEPAQLEPKVRGFGFVQTPVIAPGKMGGESPLVSWGRVEATPVVLDHGSRQFRIPEVPERDKVGQRLAEQKLKRTSTVGASPAIRPGGGKTPLASPVFSPAGQKLLEEQRKKAGSTPNIFRTPTFQSPARKPQ